LTHDKDELHRRITLAAILFTTSATFFCVLVWHRLGQGRRFSSRFPGGPEPGVQLGHRNRRARLFADDVFLLSCFEDGW
jgi:hypothetical protein